MLRVINKIDECWDGTRIPRPHSRISHIIVHRIGEEIGKTAVEVACAFRSQDNDWNKVTGRQMPYSFFIRKDGLIEQALEVMDVGWHARRWSKPGIGIAVSGNFNVEAPTAEQWESLAMLCSTLAYWLGIYELCGHTELPFASKDPDKVCPGKYLNMDDLREEVATRLSDTAVFDRRARNKMLESYGIIIDRETSLV